MPGKHTNEKLLSPLALGVFMLHVSREHMKQTQGNIHSCIRPQVKYLPHLICLQTSEGYRGVTILSQMRYRRRCFRDGFFKLISL